MLLPHLVFSSIYHNHKNAWGKVMLPSPERLGEFWKLQTKHPSYKNNPSLRDNPQFAQKLIPLSLHGDGTPVLGVGKIWSRQLTIFSFNSHLGLGTAKDRLSLSALYLSFSRFLLGLSNGSNKANTLMKTTWVKNTLHVPKKADWPTLILQMAIVAFFGRGPGVHVQSLTIASLCKQD